MNPSDCQCIVTPTQMQAIDRRAIESLGVPGLTLMENAGRGIAEGVRDRIFDGDVSDKRIAIICGPGNNGGDGFVAGRYLIEMGATVTAFLTEKAATLTGGAKTNAERYRGMNQVIIEIAEGTEFPDFGDHDCLVDAIFGTGFHGRIEGTIARVIEAMNESGLPIVAIDTPSGLDNAAGALGVPSVYATHTMALACSKRGQWFWPGRMAVGELTTIDIGIPREAVDAENVKLSLITEEYVAGALPQRPPDVHKGHFGKALIVGGSVGMSGAVVLAVRAAMRSGLGLSYAAVPASLANLVDAGSIETVVRPLPEVRQRRCLATRSLGEILKLCESVEAVAIGPGLGTHHETQELVRRLIARRTKPTVLDADGLNACAADPSFFSSDNRVPLILTPHVGEMARLLGMDASEVAADREAIARRAAAQFACIVVMKGAPTFVSEPSGHVWLNPTGNCGMATGGSGDVLTGLIVSFLAQGAEPLTAALLGVFVHGAAGDLAAADLGGRSLVATDIIDALPEVLGHLGG